MTRTFPSKDLLISVTVACSLVAIFGILVAFSSRRTLSSPATGFHAFTIDPAMFGNIREETHLRSPICELHQVAMRPQVIPIAYGLLVSVSDGSFAAEESARKKMFPNHRTFIWGGC